jgi:hypothetical protein
MPWGCFGEDTGTPQGKNAAGKRRFALLSPSSSQGKFPVNSAFGDQDPPNPTGFCIFVSIPYLYIYITILPAFSEYTVDFLL